MGFSSFHRAQRHGPSCPRGLQGGSEVLLFPFMPHQTPGPRQESGVPLLLTDSFAHVMTVWGSKGRPCLGPWAQPQECTPFPFSSPLGACSFAPQGLWRFWGELFLVFACPLDVSQREAGSKTNWSVDTALESDLFYLVIIRDLVKGVRRGGIVLV